MWNPLIQLREVLPVPMRPTAAVILSYNLDSGHVMISVRQGSVTNPIARFGGNDGLELMTFRGADGPGSDTTTWVLVRNLGSVLTGSRPATDAEALCLKVLQYSDVFCPSQARTDFPKAVESRFWQDLLDEARTLLPVAAVLTS